MTVSGTSIGLDLGVMASTYHLVNPALENEALKPNAMALMRATQQRFRGQESPAGFPWEPLKQGYGAIKSGPVRFIAPALI